MFEVYNFTSVAVHNHAVTRPSCMLCEELRKGKTHGATSATTPVCELVEASVETYIKTQLMKTTAVQSSLNQISRMAWH